MRRHCCSLRQQATPILPILTALIRAEYIEMPGLSVTLAQAARLWNIDRLQCLHVLESLMNEGFLYRSRDSVLASPLRVTERELSSQLWLLALRERSLETHL